MIGIREDLPQSFEFPEEQKDSVPKLSSILETEVDEKYYIANEKAEKIIEQALQRLEKLGNVHATITPDRVDKRQNGRRAKAEEEEMFTLTARDLHGVLINTKDFGKSKPHINVSPTLLATDYKEPKLTVVGKLDMKGMDVIKRVYDPEGLSPTLTTSEGGHRQPKILIAGSLKPDEATRHGQRDVVWDAEGLGGTICASDYKQPRPVLHNFRVRKLTPREYMRLQGFPEEYQILVSDSQMYKQMGNAVSVPVSKAIAEAIKGYLESMNK